MKQVTEERDGNWISDFKMTVVVMAIWFCINVFIFPIMVLTAMLYPYWLVEYLFGEGQDWLWNGIVFGRLFPLVVPPSIFLTMRLKSVRKRSTNVRMIVYLAVVFLDSLVLGVAIGVAPEALGVLVV